MGREEKGIYNPFLELSPVTFLNFQDTHKLCSLFFSFCVSMASLESPVGSLISINPS
jgi:hypothetical protein